MGLIDRFVALLRREAVGLGVSAFTSVSLERHGEAQSSAFDAEIRRMPEVLECFPVTGEEDYLLRIVTPDLPSFARFMTERLMRAPGVRSVKSNIVLMSIKSTTALPLAHLGAPSQPIRRARRTSHSTPGCVRSRLLQHQRP